jgi:DNA-binding transcriptional ArsR family regulator
MSTTPIREVLPECDLDLVLRALADPTRREVLRIVADRELSVTDVAKRMDGLVSVPTVSRHLAILRGAGLVQEEPGFGGRNRYKMQLGCDYMIKRAFASLLKMWDR